LKISAGQIVAITGAGSGIGRALALHVAKRGCHVAVADIDAKQLAETAEMVKAEGVNCSTHVVDVAR
jgi:NAD(P)-dependent dehydrogenase (short-subunit alcohol dehydrogenase family)